MQNTTSMIAYGTPRVGSPSFQYIVLCITHFPSTFIFSLFLSLTSHKWHVCLQYKYLFIQRSFRRSLRLLVHSLIQCSACIDLRRHLWDRGPPAMVLGDRNPLKKIQQILLSAHPEHLIDNILMLKQLNTFCLK